MSDTLASLRHQIDGAHKLESVVRTMKVLAASSVSQYEAAVRALADYERALNLGLSVCLRQGGPIALPPSKSGAPAEVFAIIFGSDRGLVGQFNENMAEFAAAKLNALPGRKNVWAVGERMFGCLTDLALQPIAQFGVPVSVAGITPLIGEMQAAIESRGVWERFAPFYVFHSRPQAMTAYAPASRRLLPLDNQWRRDLVKMKWPTQRLPEVIGGDESALRGFIREYFFISLFQACAESLAAENASRLAAMQRAEKNIDELCQKLTRVFHRLRQNSIDAELFDVVAGYNSLNV